MEQSWSSLPIYQGLQLGLDFSPLLLELYSYVGRFVHCEYEPAAGHGRIVQGLISSVNRSLP